MATQRLLLLKVIGASGRLIADRCREWERRQCANPDDTDLRGEVGRLAEALDTHRAELPVVHYAEWPDRWSMLDTFATPFHERGVVLNGGGRFDLVCCTDDLAAMRTLRADGWQFDEPRMLAERLREAAAAGRELVGDATLVLLRETLGPSTLDEQVTAATAGVPEWLTGGTSPDKAGGFARPETC